MTTLPMDPWVLWAIIIAVAIGTVAIRLSFLLLIEWVDDIPPSVETTLEFVPPAVLAAIAVPALVYVDGTLAVTPANERLLAGALAVVVSWRTESVLATLAVGMGALWTLQWVV